MAKKYTKVQEVACIVFERKAAGETNRAIAASLQLTLKQVKQLITRENHRKARLQNGIPQRPKGRPRKAVQSEEARREHEIKELRMTVEHQRNSLSEAGRR